MATKRKGQVTVQFAFSPYPKQQIVYEYMQGKHLNAHGLPYRFFVMAFGRQAGKSWFARYTALDSSINRAKYVMWVAPALSSARNHWNKLVKLLRASGIPCKILQASKEIHFPNGGAIVIRSADIPDNLRGDSVDVLLLDEAAFFPNGEYVWYQVCLPMITASRGVVLFTSTPKGRNWFYDVYEMGQDPNNEYFKSWQLKSEESPYQDKALLKFLKKTMPSIRWREEFEAEFLLDGGGVFAGIERAARVTFISEPKADAHYVCGIDLAPLNDNCVITFMDKDSREQVYGEAFTNTGLIPTIKRIIELLDMWQPEITHIEKNGVGEYFIQLLRAVLQGNDVQEMLDSINKGLLSDDSAVLEEIVGGHRIRAIHMDNPIKRELVERLAADVEFGRAFLLEPITPFGKQQVKEISTFQRVPTQSGQQMTYKAAQGNHDDCVSALYLCYKGMPKPLRVLPKNKSKKDLSELFSSKGKNFHAKRSKIHTPNRLGAKQLRRTG